MSGMEITKWGCGEQHRYAEWLNEKLTYVLRLDVGVYEVTLVVKVLQSEEDLFGDDFDEWS